MSRKLTLEQVITGFQKVHGDKYDYSLITEYKNNSQKLPIICPKHGVFYQEQYVHISGHGCPECAKIKSDNLRRSEQIRKEFIERVRKVHGDKYDLSRVKYVNQNTKIEVGCPIHGFWWTNPYSFYTGHGCPVCGKAINQLGNEKRRKEASEKFVEKARKIHGDKYDYSKVVYTGANKKVTIVCPEHGEFEQVASYHLSGNGCPKCSHHISKWEQEVFDMVNGWFPGEVYHSQKGLIVVV